MFGVPSSSISARSILIWSSRVEARQQVHDLAVDRADRLQHALAAVALLVAVAQLDRLVRAGRGAGRHGGAAHGAAFELDLDLDGGIAATVQDFAGANVDDGAHEKNSFWGAVSLAARLPSGK